MTNRQDAHEDSYFYDICRVSIYNNCPICVTLGTFIFKSYSVPSTFDIVNEITDKNSENYNPYTYKLKKDTDSRLPFLYDANNIIRYISNIRKV